MSRKTASQRCVSARILCLMTACVTAIPSSGTRAGETPTLDEIKSQLAKQPPLLKSLYIAVTLESKLTVDPKVYVTLPGHQDNVILAKFEEQYAFKGDKRYSRRLSPRVVKSPWRVKPPQVDPKAGPIEQARQKQLKEQYERMKKNLPAQRETSPPDEYRLMPDETFAVNGKLQWNRHVPGKGQQSQLFLDRLDESLHWGQSAGYLVSIGWSVPDPTEHIDGAADSKQVRYLPNIFRSPPNDPPYEVAARIAIVDGAKCVVLHAHGPIKITGGGVSETVTIDDTIWLDLDHGLALKQRMYALAKDHITRTVTADFVEIVPGLWFPKSVVTECLVPPSGPAEYRSKPMQVVATKLTKWVVNQVPDDLFDVAPRPAKDERIWDMRVPGMPR